MSTVYTQLRTIGSLDRLPFEIDLEWLACIYIHTLERSKSKCVYTVNPLNVLEFINEG